MNDAFLRDLRDNWAKHGPAILDRVAREQPGTYMKVMAMLMPKEMSTQELIGGLSDEQLGAVIRKLEEQIAGALSGEHAKLVNGHAERALPAPAKPWRPKQRKKKETVTPDVTADDNNSA